MEIKIKKELLKELKKVIYLTPPYDDSKSAYDYLESRIKELKKQIKELKTTHNAEEALL